MKTVYANLRLIFSGDTVCLGFSVATFLAALADATQWPALRAFRFCIICTMLFSLTFSLLCALEAFKYPRRKRTIIAAVLFLAATALCLSHHTVVRVG